MTPPAVPDPLNFAAASVVDRCLSDAALRVAATNVGGATVVDFGVKAEGGLRAGVELAHVCLAGLGSVAIESGTFDGRPWPHVTMRTDQPVAACLLSQYAGWQIAVGKYFAMGSGPMRAVARVEPLFEELDHADESDRVVGVLESGRLPDEPVVAWLCEKLRIGPERLTLCVAPTASVAGTIQVVARSVETALHKLHELKFDVARVRS
ncbi:MAG TPA: methenyltetrahydromethanopterin cyclohydrolase, partial [Planctomycetaceae bacterium]